MTTNHQTTTLPRLLTPEEVSDYLGVPRRTMDRWRSTGTGPPAVRFGKAIRYPEHRLLAWIDAETDRADDRG